MKQSILCSLLISSAMGIPDISTQSSFQGNNQPVGCYTTDDCCPLLYPEFWRSERANHRLEPDYTPLISSWAYLRSSGKVVFRCWDRRNHDMLLTLRPPQGPFSIRFVMTCPVNWIARIIPEGVRENSPYAKAMCVPGGSTLEDGMISAGSTSCFNFRSILGNKRFNIWLSKSRVVHFEQPLPSNIEFYDQIITLSLAVVGQTPVVAQVPNIEPIYEVFDKIVPNTLYRACAKLPAQSLEKYMHVNFLNT